MRVSPRPNIADRAPTVLPIANDVPAPCKTCALSYGELRRVDAALMAGETIEAVSAWSKIGSGSLTRHRLNHLYWAVREVRIDETRTAADVLVTLVDTMADVERVREDAIRRGNHSAALRASAESRALARMVFTELNVESTELLVRPPLVPVVRRDGVVDVLIDDDPSAGLRDGEADLALPLHAEALARRVERYAEVDDAVDGQIKIMFLSLGTHGSASFDR